MADRIISIILIVFSALYIAATLQLPEPVQTGAVGPRGFPLLLGMALVVASLALFFKPSRTKTAPADAANTRTVFLVAVTIMGYVLVLRFTGLVISTFLFLSTVLLIWNRGKPVLNVSIALVSALVVYGLIRTLQVSLPQGLLALP